ncbi:hypothetical protein BWI17_21520 [Betaproteobacteria bacterium GR16-43]|nr:hypothetical protein BWI17_21520 [Betaproteobacteria bacterium GR16-43]
MTKVSYGWVPGGPPPVGQQHTFAKHDVLRAYLNAYVHTLASLPQQEVLRLTLVDGFAGGGIYRHEKTGELKLGSPFVFLDAIREAEVAINIGRPKPLKVEADYFFIESDIDAFRVLQRTLHDRGQGPRIGCDINLFNGKFQDHARAISAFIAKKSPRSGRSIFLLDQCGYSEVPGALIRSIFADHPSAEVILTFAVDALINFASDSAKTEGILRNIDLPDPLNGRTFEEIKTSESDFRFYIQSCMYQRLVQSCGASFFTVFFIRTEGHGDFWLVHLSQHPRARDVMTTVHWSHNNHFIHYGGAGIDMFHVLGYESARDSDFTGQGDLGFLFDDPAKRASVEALMRELPQFIFANEDGVSFGELFRSTCNSSPADSAKYKEALELLVRQKEINIVAPSGARRFRASTIENGDLLVPSRQISIPFD